MSRPTHSVVITALILSGCSQFTTSDVERSAMRAAADQHAEAYLECIRAGSAQYDGTVVSADLVFTAVADSCNGNLDKFRIAATTYYESKVILTEPPVSAEVEELERRARSLIAASAVAAATRPAARTVQPAATSAVAVSGNASTAERQRDRQAYLNCMSEQAQRYAALEESAATIAEVAQDACSDRSGSAASAALEKDGRTLVLREVLEARVAEQGR